MNEQCTNTILDPFAQQLLLLMLPVLPLLSTAITLDSAANATGSAITPAATAAAASHSLQIIKDTRYYIFLPLRMHSNFSRCLSIGQ